MTLDEAIEHASWCARNSEGECSDEHRQLVAWLTELRRLRQQIHQLQGDEKLEAENERLREFASWLVEYVDPAGYQDICNIECPASTRCRGKSTCAFPDWVLEKAKELGIEVWTDE